MRDLFVKLNNYLVSNITQLEKSVRKAREKEIESVDFFAASIGVVNLTQYKEVKSRREDDIFISCFGRDDANGKNGDLGAYWLKDKVVEVLDEMSESLTDSNLKFYLVKFQDAKEEPEYRGDLDLWELPVQFKIRWRKL